MAEARISEDQFWCPVCLDLLKDPVAIPCGHTYCMGCITDCWHQEDLNQVYSCPQCRETFNPRPSLAKNTILAEVVKQLKKAEDQNDVPAGAGDVECGVCGGRKLKAIKSCLVCLNSYCQNHLNQHDGLFKGKKHDLIDATGRLQEMICHQHDKLLEVYCRTDQCCICMLCMKHVRETQEKFLQQIQERDKKLQELKDAVETHGLSAEAAVQDLQSISSELILAVERRCCEVSQIIREREKMAARHAEGLMKQLDLETLDLKAKNAELEKLSKTSDHVHFIKSFPFLPVPPASLEVPCITAGSYDDVAKSFSKLKHNILESCSKETERMSGQVLCVQIIPTPEFEKREEFLRYFYRFTLDPNTVNQCLLLSKSSRSVFVGPIQHYPDHPDRFERPQVLCSESVCGRCYWEAEWSGERDVYISVSYETISRKGTFGETLFGGNSQSWSLVCSPSRCYFSHNHTTTNLPAVPSNRIGVYVDHKAGILSFYSVSDRMHLIQRIHTTFTQPLFPGFGFGCGFGFGLSLSMELRGVFKSILATKKHSLTLCDI